MKIVITGGGSGGHVYPAIAIADKFREKDPTNDILYIGYMYGFEKDVVPKAGYRRPITLSMGRRVARM